MEWTQLLSGKRLGIDAVHERKHERTNFQRDYDRLVFSSAFRRLQNKTQVFPLPGSIFVHNRLTHSLEVSCVGRSLGNNVATGLIQQYGTDEPGFTEMGAIVSAACLAHDMGNPPFGHSGERAISAYFLEGNGRRLEEEVRNEGGRWEDFVRFEGNANAMRLLTHQFVGRRTGGFVLTYSTIAAIVKYPFASTQTTKGKFGFFQSEENTYKRIANELGIVQPDTTVPKFVRYPLVFLVEAADDICYQIMDIEDAHKLKLLTTNETVDLMLQFFHGKRLDSVQKTLRIVSDINEQIAYLRSAVIGLLVDECTKIFLLNESKLLQGNYNQALINDIATLPKNAYNLCSKIAHEKIYVARDVVDIELAGYHIFEYLIDTLTDAIFKPHTRYNKLLLNRMPKQYDINAITPYGKIQCILDYISGMTDVYALDLYRKITGMKLPQITA
jgi:dGTPase